MAAKGSFSNPTEKWCWTFCASCNRCQDKGKYNKCKGCSGRYDPEGTIEPDQDDYCDCKNGVLRWKTKEGKLLIVKFTSNPFKGKVTYKKKSEDERDWDAYVNDMREKLDDPTWDPITIIDED